MIIIHCESAIGRICKVSIPKALPSGNLEKASKHEIQIILKNK